MNKVKIYLVKFQLVVVAFVFFSLCSISQVCAQETGENYSKAVKAALYVVKEMSDKESVAIGSIYNVVDVNGELEGYSLGYYIGDEPYGYAIYSIEKESITEFVFSQGCNNLFNELADKAKEENIDEDNLIDGIIYEGYITYSVADTKGNVLDTDGNKKNSNINKLKKIDNSVKEHNNTLPKQVTRTNHDIYYYCDGMTSSQLPYLGKATACCVPNCGLAFFGQDQVIASSGRYCCVVSAVTGLVNWLGLMDNSLSSTYLDLWDKCEAFFTPSNQTTYGGASRYNAALALNQYFEEYNADFVAYTRSSPQFYDYISWFSGFDSSVSRPVTLSLSSNDWESGHTMIAVATYSTAYTSSDIYNDYLGIYNEWTDWNGTVSNAESCIRYIDYAELTADNVNILVTYVDNVQDINCVNSYVSNTTGINVSCTVPYGTVSVKYPTWTTYNGQDDIVWHTGTLNGRNSTVQISIDSHNSERGQYYTHIYAYDAQGNVLGFYGTEIINVKSDISDISYNSVNDDGFTVFCRPPYGTKYIKFPTWTANNGQDDIIWYNGTVYSSSAIRRIYFSDHNNESGTYNVHIYAYDKNMNLISVATSSIYIE